MKKIFFTLCTLSLVAPLSAMDGAVPLVESEGASERLDVSTLLEKHGWDEAKPFMRKGLADLREKGNCLGRFKYEKDCFIEAMKHNDISFVRELMEHSQHEYVDGDLEAAAVRNLAPGDMWYVLECLSETKHHNGLVPLTRVVSNTEDFSDEEIKTVLQNLLMLSMLGKLSMPSTGRGYNVHPELDQAIPFALVRAMNQAKKELKELKKLIDSRKRR